MSKVIWCDAWMWPIYYGFCPNPTAWQAEMKKMGIVEHYPTRISTGAATTEFNWNGHNNRYIVTIGHNPTWTPRAVASMLQHEAVHVFQHLCETIGEHEPSSEFEAYTVAAISHELIKAYEKTRGVLFRGETDYVEAGLKNAARRPRTHGNRAAGRRSAHRTRRGLRVGLRHAVRRPTKGRTR